MRLIRKVNEPSLLQDYRRQNNATYEDMDTLVKEELRKSLVAEQFGICAYCQRKLTDIKIEHHCERSICTGENGFPDRRLDYRNLLAVCQGRNGQPIELHCDTKKADVNKNNTCLLYTSPSPRDLSTSRMPSSA